MAIFIEIEKHIGGMRKRVNLRVAQVHDRAWCTMWECSENIYRKVSCWPPWNAKICVVANASPNISLQNLPFLSQVFLSLIIFSLKTRKYLKICEMRTIWQLVTQSTYLCFTEKHNLTVFNYLSTFLTLLSSSSSKSGHSEVEKDSGSSSSEPLAPESDRHVYKSVLEGGDIPLQGLRALNKRHGSSSSKGRIPASLHTWPVKWQVCVCLWMWELHIKAVKGLSCWDRTDELQTLMLDCLKSQAGIHVFPFTFLLECTHFLCSQTSRHWPITSQHSLAQSLLI